MILTLILYVFMCVHTILGAPSSPPAGTTPEAGPENVTGQPAANGAFSFSLFPISSSLKIMVFFFLSPFLSLLLPRGCFLLWLPALGRGY